MAGRVRVREISDDEGVVTGIVQEFQFGMNWSNYSVFVAFCVYPRRAILGATLMVTQSFLYNAIFFTYALVLTRFYHVSNDNVLLYGLTFAVGNLAGPLLLGHLFDTIGRKKMISGTYLISGLARLLVRGCSRRGALSAAGQVFIWIVVFLFASAGSSAGYLT